MRAAPPPGPPTARSAPAPGPARRDPARINPITPITAIRSPATHSLPILPTKHRSPVSHSHGSVASELSFSPVFFPCAAPTRTPPPLNIKHAPNLYFLFRVQAEIQRSGYPPSPPASPTPPPPSSQDSKPKRTVSPSVVSGWPNHSGSAPPSPAASLFPFSLSPPPRPRVLGGFL